MSEAVPIQNGIPITYLSTSSLYTKIKDCSSDFTILNSINPGISPQISCLKPDTRCRKKLKCKQETPEEKKVYIDSMRYKILSKTNLRLEMIIDEYIPKDSRFKDDLITLIYDSINRYNYFKQTASATQLEYIREFNNYLTTYYELSYDSVVKSFIDTEIPYKIIKEFNKGNKDILIVWIQTKLGYPINFSLSRKLIGIEDYIKTYFKGTYLYDKILEDYNYNIFYWQIMIENCGIETDFPELHRNKFKYITAELHHGYPDDENILCIKLGKSLYRIDINITPSTKTLLSSQEYIILEFIHNEYKRLTKTNWFDFI